jgi:hypothetical protein
VKVGNEVGEEVVGEEVILMSVDELCAELVDPRGPPADVTISLGCVEIASNVPEGFVKNAT